MLTDTTGVPEIGPLFLAVTRLVETTQKFILESKASLVIRSLTNATRGSTLIWSSGSSILLSLFFIMPVTKECSLILMGKGGFSYITAGTIGSATLISIGNSLKGL